MPHPKPTGEISRLQQMLEPVYQSASNRFNAAVLGRAVSGSILEGLSKGEHWPTGSYMAQSAPGLHETVQSVYARATQTVQSVNEQLSNTGTFNAVPGVK